MFLNGILALLIGRVVLDLAYPEDKPFWAVSGYTAGMLLVIARLAIMQRRTPHDVLLASAMLLSMAVPIFLVPPSKLVDQITFAAQVALPAVLLLLLSNVYSFEFKTLRRRFAIFGLPVGSALFCSLIFAAPRNEDVLAFLNANPFHASAQVVAKVGILYCARPLILPGAFVVGLALLNVRSALLGYMVGLVAARARHLGALVALPFGLAALVGLWMLWTGMSTEDLISRFVERDRSEFLDDSLNSVSSGRIGIWAHYGRELLERTNLLTSLFGSGVVWSHYDPIEGVRPYMAGETRLGAHNDVLNLLVCYGLSGFLILSVCWGVILSRIEHPYMLPSIAVFVVLFLTNGVVFHQSNILFALYFASWRQLGDQRDIHESKIDMGRGSGRAYAHPTANSQGH